MKDILIIIKLAPDFDHFDDFNQTSTCRKEFHENDETEMGNLILYLFGRSVDLLDQTTFVTN